ncbi:MAG: hypothetical protein PHO30_01420 [Candidatus Omnitrophica bacterium]|jgi:hypothetical protein|nr:hypothetical protein [Candidatus Omnitrophota bacterium]
MFYREIVYIVLGILLLMMGRKLFWLFVGGTGFIVGIEYAGLVFRNQPEGVILIAALVMALIGLILAIVIQKVGVGIAGFLSGGYVAMSIVQKFGYAPGWLPGLVFLVGGIIGAILVVKLFDIALVILSSLTGAFLIISAVNVGPESLRILFIVLTVTGMVIQVSQGKPEE